MHHRHPHHHHYGRLRHALHTHPDPETLLQESPHHGLRRGHGQHASRHSLPHHHHTAEATGAALGYAAAESPNPDGGFLNHLFSHHDAPSAAPGGYKEPPYASEYGQPRPGVAVYNIKDHTVYMPDGSRLEAHSGIGEGLYDNPASADKRDKGVTPPARYKLSLREASFHGVEALRLTPIAGTGNTYGRNGLLAHTDMLDSCAPHEPGASNGCVSFKNYNAFLQAFKNGQVRELEVVAGDAPAPAMHVKNNKRTGTKTAPATKASPAQETYGKRGFGGVNPNPSPFD